MLASHLVFQSAAPETETKTEEGRDQGQWGLCKYHHAIGRAEPTPGRVLGKSPRKDKESKEEREDETPSFEEASNCAASQGLGQRRGWLARFGRRSPTGQGAGATGREEWTQAIQTKATSI